MSSKTTYAEISPLKLDRHYRDGMSISEIASSIGRSYTFTRSRLVASGVVLRSKEEGTRLFISTHPSWSAQFIKYHVQTCPEVTVEKALLLCMVLTEGYTDSTSFGFTNTQGILHDRFRNLVKDAYGDVPIGMNRITSRVSSVEISRDLTSMLPGKAFSDEVLRFIVNSRLTTVQILRIIADTEGAFLISIKRAKRNFTVESRIVLASSNPQFTRQIAHLLDALGIQYRASKSGVSIYKSSQIAAFTDAVGFSPGVKVIRKKAGVSTWYGCEKVGLQRLFFRIMEEQRQARRSGRRGAFADCTTKEQTVRRLKGWFAELNGGERS